MFVCMYQNLNTLGITDAGAAAFDLSPAAAASQGGEGAGGVRSVQSSVDDIDLADEYLKRVSVLLAPSIDSTGVPGAGLTAGAAPSTSVDSTGVVTYASKSFVCLVWIYSNLCLCVM